VALPGQQVSQSNAKGQNQGQTIAALLLIPRSPIGLVHHGGGSGDSSLSGTSLKTITVPSQPSVAQFSLIFQF